MPKTGSTSIEAEISGVAQLITREHPSMKHVRVEGFEKYFAPFLRNCGFPRTSYHTTCVIREPVDWLVSWWRYRARPALATRAPQRYTGETPFPAFATQVMEGAVKLGRQARFLQPGVDRLFPYEDLEPLRRWLSDQVGEDLQFRSANASPGRQVEIDGALRRELEAFYAPEFELWRRDTESPGTECKVYSLAG